MAAEGARRPLAPTYDRLSPTLAAQSVRATLAARKVSSKSHTALAVSARQDAQSAAKQCSSKRPVGLPLEHEEALAADTRTLWHRAAPDLPAKWPPFPDAGRPLV
mmetsp:Transcript_35450/g.77597  ORF Transcript_35450/g.77597 Transcript_35450/m.77597 type:complete len:105 (-) Transcript_35450:222-536(-)